MRRIPYHFTLQLLCLPLLLSLIQSSSAVPGGSDHSEGLGIEDFVRTDARPWYREALETVEQPQESGIRTVVDVMVLYTTEARQAYGREAVENDIALGMAFLNEACRRSGVQAYFRLIYTAETTWHTASPEMPRELAWLCADPKVAELQDVVGADLVSLLVLQSGPTTGFAQLPGTFSVFNGRASIFAHEIGHNLGCEHDRAHSDVSQSEGCNFGYSFIPPGTTDLYGDIMSYVGSEIEQFSSPRQYFLRAPTGLLRGHTDGQAKPDSADNVHCLNLAVPEVGFARTPRVTLLTSPSLSADGNEFCFAIEGPDRGQCIIEWSDDLSSWTVLADCILSGSRIELDNHAEGIANRFYRARLGDGYLRSQLGYIKRTVPVGYAMIANQLETENHSIGFLLANVPEGTQLYKWIEGQQAWICSTFSGGNWDHPEITLHPGEGAIIRNRSTAPFNLQFVGTINPALHNRVPLDYAIRCSAIPLRGGLSSRLHCLPIGPSGQVYRMTGTDGSYTVYTFDHGTWQPTEPTIELGESFWSRNPVNAFLWENVLR